MSSVRDNSFEVAIIQHAPIFLNIDDWKKIAQAHSLFFDGIRPASSMVEVNRLISPEMLVEIEAEAYVR